MAIWLLVALICVLTSCTQSAPKPVMPADLSLRPGDIVLRRGMGVTSRVVYTADADGCYSHLGIVVDTDSGLMVVHAVPDEPDDRGVIDIVRIERPEQFFAPERAEAGAVVRVRDTTAIPKAMEYALDAYRRHVPFDHRYDDDSTALYCCELVDNAYRHGGVQLVGTDRHRFSVPGFMEVCCILPSDILNSTAVECTATFR